MEIKDFEQAVKSGDFNLAKQLINLEDYKIMDNTLSKMGFENSNDISPYFFILDLLLEKETAELHSLASLVISFPFSWMPGAYSLGLKHVKKAIELAPNNINYKQLILFYHDIPDCLLSKEETIKYAKQVLDFDPSAKVAKDIIDRYKND